MKKLIFAILLVTCVFGYTACEGLGLTDGPTNKNNLEVTVNGVTFTMVKVEAGTFIMGAQSEDPDGLNYDSEASVVVEGSEMMLLEKPVHKVTLSQDYYIGETEVTQKLWEAVMGEPCPNLSFTGDQLPVSALWKDIVEKFIPKLNELTGMTFSLPTEAQWEFAARGGNKSQGYKYCGSNDVDKVSWYDRNSSLDGVPQPHPVGMKLANELGIYDMSGNEDEWCQDGISVYFSDHRTDPLLCPVSKFGVVRGGTYDDIAMLSRVAARSMNCREGKTDDPRDGDGYSGFRLVCFQ